MMKNLAVLHNCRIHLFTFPTKLHLITKSFAFKHNPVRLNANFFNFKDTNYNAFKHCGKTHLLCLHVKIKYNYKYAIIFFQQVPIGFHTYYFNYNEKKNAKLYHRTNE